VRAITGTKCDLNTDTKEDPLVGKYRIWALVQNTHIPTETQFLRQILNGNITLAQYEVISKDGIMPIIP
jgi:hypothetical protein